MTTSINPLDGLCSLDIGFDLNALPKDGNRGSVAGDQDCPQLRFGFTVPGQVGNPVALATRWHRGDKMLLTLYDLTSVTLVPAEIDYLSLSLRFQKSLEQPALSPVTYCEAGADPLDGVYAQFEIHRSVSDERQSTVFEEKTSSWNVYPPPQSSPTDPANQFSTSRKTPKASFVVVNPGSFYYSVELRVGVGQDVKAFRVDPEMVVDNNGGTIPPDD